MFLLANKSFDDTCSKIWSLQQFWNILFTQKRRNSNDSTALCLKKLIISYQFDGLKLSLQFCNSWRVFSIFFNKTYTAWKVSVFGVFPVRIFPHLDWIWRDTKLLNVLLLLFRIKHWNLQKKYLQIVLRKSL